MFGAWMQRGDMGTPGDCSPWGQLGGQDRAELAELVFPSPHHAYGLLSLTGLQWEMQEICWDLCPGKPKQRGSPCFCHPRAAESHGGAHRPQHTHLRVQDCSPEESRGPVGSQLGIALVRIRPRPAARPALAIPLGAIEAREGGQEGEARRCTQRDLWRAPSRRLQRGCVGPRASQRRAIRANLI